jgi:prepilin-type N-terminal cleavage/methylation domain-containing protein
MFKNNGFTLIELLVTVTIVAVLSAIILFTITQYISRSKDANVKGNLATLVPAGEVWYNNNGSYGYQDFCTSNVILNASNNISKPKSGADCTTGICCYVKSDNNAWAACAQLFADNTKAYCVDSRGVKEDNMSNNACANLVANQTYQCP